MIATSAPTSSAVPPYEKPLPTVLPISAKFCPWLPVMVRVMVLPGSTVVALAANVG
jgi:hypothetical protein